MNDQLLQDYDRIMEYCYRLFRDKNADYGPTWLLYRSQSLNDEIWRKAKRIRTLEEHADAAQIPEGRDVEYVGIINYCVMFLIQLNGAPGIPTGADLTEELSRLDAVDEKNVYSAYEAIRDSVRQLLIRKNTDYGDAWKSMSLAAMTDQVIIRVYRIRRILANQGQLRVSEGVSSQLRDIINYCVFALIKMGTTLITLS
ncbi:MAG: DUF1599 domain-containing protein [Oscillospiraceae bacterium]|nr:DUF1599 domain-containing protein [Oscillospiraceae bacterium]